MSNKTAPIVITLKRRRSSNNAPEPEKAPPPLPWRRPDNPAQRPARRRSPAGPSPGGVSTPVLCDFRRLPNQVMHGEKLADLVTTFHDQVCDFFRGATEIVAEQEVRNQQVRSSMDEATRAAHQFLGEMLPPEALPTIPPPLPPLALRKAAHRAQKAGSSNSASSSGGPTKAPGEGAPSATAPGPARAAGSSSSSSSSRDHAAAPGGSPSRGEGGPSTMPPAPEVAEDSSSSYSSSQDQAAAPEGTPARREGPAPARDAFTKTLLPKVVDLVIEDHSAHQDTLDLLEACVRQYFSKDKELWDLVRKKDLLPLFRALLRALTAEIRGREPQEDKGSSRARRFG